MTLNDTTYSAADVLTSAAFLIEQDGYIYLDADPFAHPGIEDFGPGKGYDIPRAFDQAVYGELNWSGSFEVLLGFAKRSDQYAEAHDALRDRVLADAGPDVFGDNDKFDIWAGSLTTESAAALLRDVAAHLPVSV